MPSSLPPPPPPPTISRDLSSSRHRLPSCFRCNSTEYVRTLLLFVKTSNFISTQLGVLMGKNMHARQNYTLHLRKLKHSNICKPWAAGMIEKSATGSSTLIYVRTRPVLVPPAHFHSFPFLLRRHNRMCQTRRNALTSLPPSKSFPISLSDGSNLHLARSSSLMKECATGEELFRSRRPAT